MSINNRLIAILSISIMILGLSGCASQQTHQEASSNNHHKIEKVETSYKLPLNRSQIVNISHNTHLLDKACRQAQKDSHQKELYATFNPKKNTVNVALPKNLSQVILNGDIHDKSNRDLVARLIADTNAESTHLSLLARDDKLGVQIYSYNHKLIYASQNGVKKFCRVKYSKSALESYSQKPGLRNKLPNFA